MTLTNTKRLLKLKASCILISHLAQGIVKKQPIYPEKTKKWTASEWWPTEQGTRIHNIYLKSLKWPSIWLCSCHGKKRQALVFSCSDGSDQIAILPTPFWAILTETQNSLLVLAEVEAHTGFCDWFLTSQSHGFIVWWLTVPPAAVCHPSQEWLFLRRSSCKGSHLFIP